MARKEKFSAPPRALSPQYKAQRFEQRMTAFDHQRLAMERLRREENARTKNIEELHAELFDFTMITEVDEYGFPVRTPYEISDAMSSVYVPPKPEEGQTDQKENSVKDQDPKEDPDPGTE